MALWDPDPLWDKTRLYASRAAAEEQEGPLFAFWSILSLELLGRTVVANVHPGLLADPQNPDNLMYAFGLGEMARPKSVPAATVFRRCRKIVSEFTEADLAGSIGLIELRNQELHSGDTPFEGLKTGSWLPDYYRLCELLLRSLDRGLEDLFGYQQAAAARRLIDGAAEELESEVKQYIADVRAAFEELELPQRQDKQLAARAHIQRIAEESFAPHELGNVISCPACGTDAWLTGEFVRSGEPVADADAIVREIVKIPTRLQCLACGIDIRGYARLHAVDLGGLFSLPFREDPASYYHIEFDPGDFDWDFYEEDYGNE